MVMPDGRTSFAALQQAAAGTASHAPLVYFVFDLIRLDGERLDRLPLEERKARLRALVEPASPKPKSEGGPAAPKPEAKAGRIRYADHVVGDGDTLFEHAASIGLEGIISKRRDLPYHPGRHDSWQKSKVIQRGTFVIGGVTDPEGTRVGIGALLVGYYDGAAAGLRRPRRHRLLARLRHRAARAARRTRAAAVPVRSADPQGTGATGALGEAVARVRSDVHRMDQRRAAAPPGVREDPKGREAERRQPPKLRL